MACSIVTMSMGQYCDNTNVVRDYGLAADGFPGDRFKKTRLWLQVRVTSFGKSTVSSLGILEVCIHLDSLRSLNRIVQNPSYSGNSLDCGAHCISTDFNDQTIANYQ